jgi:hypothetical protein
MPGHEIFAFTAFTATHDQDKRFPVLGGTFVEEKTPAFANSLGQQVCRWITVNIYHVVNESIISMLSSLTKSSMSSSHGAAKK